MSNIQNQKNSFVSMLEQIAILNKNSTEIITQLNNVLTVQDSSVTVNQTNTDGTVSTYNLPTVAYLKAQIDLANANIQKLLGLEGSTYVINGTSSKKVYTLDLSVEPTPITNVGNVSTFTADRNWFFESLMNPLLSVNVDLTGKLDNNVNKVLSDRYIVQFTKNPDGTLDANGTTSKNDFTSKFIGRIDITETEFLNWYQSPTNLGVLNGTNPDKTLDEQIFDINLKTLNFHGTYSVLTMNQDTLNRKVWYQLDTLLYAGTDGSVGTLAVNDVLILNRKDSSSKYQIKEISALNRTLTLQTIEGYDPVPIGQAVLQYYSPVTANQAVKISVGYNEYNVLFIKPIDTENNVLSSVESKGTAYYTGDLILQNSVNNQRLTDFYNLDVNDYGAIIKDLGNRIIPTSVAVQLDPPTLNVNDYQVVQTNRYLTDNATKTNVEALNTARKNLKSQIAAKQQLITDQNNLLATNKNLPDNAKTNINNTIDKANSDINNLTAQLNSVINQILASTVDASVQPEFSIRGFFPMPAPKNGQNAIKFEVQYRSNAKDGSVTPTQSYTMTTNTAKTTAYFSNWTSIVSDIRKRTYNYSTSEWVWNIEDVSNAEIININQIDIPIHPNEGVDFRVRTISEVGYPESLIFSDWSPILNIPFPDSLTNQSLSLADQGIVPDTYKDQAVLEVNQNLQSQGYPQHISTSKTVGQTYYSHTDVTILTSFLDAAGNNTPLGIYLQQLTDRISTLEQLVAGAKGELSVILVNSAGQQILTNGSITTVVIEAEDYATPIDTTTYRTYKNEIYTIKDYSLQIANISSANLLGLLSDRLFQPINNGSGNTNTFYTDPTNQVMLVDQYDRAFPQVNNQWIWFADTYNSQNIAWASGITTNTNPINGYYNPSIVEPILNSPGYNLGTNSVAYPNINQTPTLSNFIYLLASGVTGGDTYVEWNGNGNKLYVPYAGGLMTTVHPMITNVDWKGTTSAPSTSDIVNRGLNNIYTINQSAYYQIPINIYFKFNNSGSTNFAVGNGKNDNSLIRTVSIFVEQDGQQRPFTATIQFKIRQYKLTITSRQDRSKFSASTLVQTVSKFLNGK